ARKRCHCRIRRFKPQSERPQIAHVERTLIQSGPGTAIKDETIAPEEEDIAPAKVADPYWHARARRGARDFLPAIRVEQDIELLPANTVGLALRKLGGEELIDVLASPHQRLGIAPAYEHDRRGRTGGLNCAGHWQRVHDIAQVPGLHQSDTGTRAKFRLPRPPMPAPAVLALPRTHHPKQVCE